VLVSGPQWQSNDYSIPDAALRTAFASSLEDFSNGSFEQAHLNAIEAGYEFCVDPDFARWRPITPEQGGAFVLIRRTSNSTWALGVPHPIQDVGTLEEAQDIFLQSDARALISSGTDRCANLAAAACDGMSTACSTNEQPYRESDMAHVDDSLFHIAHTVLAARYPAWNFVSLHGMTFEGASISDGTLFDTSPDSLVAIFRNALQEELPGQDVSTCNAYVGANVRYLRCGTTNTQGRAINESSNSCVLEAEGTSGRFIHLEQSPEVRLEATAVANALIVTDG
jgi:hypothetical protein